MAKSSFSSKPLQGFWLKPVCETDSPEFGHHLCGRNNIHGALSPNSGRPLLLLGSIDTADPKLAMQSIGVRCIPLLYSWTCGISSGVFSYQMSPTFKVIDYSVGEVSDSFPYSNYPDFFPLIQTALIPLKEEEQLVIHAINEKNEPQEHSANSTALLQRPQHQVGGEPRLMQDLWSTLVCQKCSAPMPFFAAIANDNGSTKGFADNDFVQVIFHICEQCAVLSCYHLVD